MPGEKVGIKEKFFDLGGHSLLAIRVVGRIKKRFNVEIQIRELFIADTIQALAISIGKKMENMQVLEDLKRTDPVTDDTEIDEITI